MRDHMQTLFSNQALKAWVAGLVVALGAYLIPVMGEWIASLTPEMVSGYLNVPYAVATVIVAVVGIVWTYAVKNR